MKVNFRVLLGLVVAGIALSACGGDGSLSGRYVGQAGGETMVINFLDDTKATFAMGETGPTVDCTYQTGETLITLSCFGSSGISLTRVAGGLEANMGGMLVRYKKQ